MTLTDGQLEPVCRRLCCRSESQMLLIGVENRGLIASCVFNASLSDVGEL